MTCRECDRKATKRGWCAMHYQREWRKANPAYNARYVNGFRWWAFIAQGIGVGRIRVVTTEAGLLEALSRPEPFYARLPKS